MERIRWRGNFRQLITGHHIYKGKIRPYMAPALSVPARLVHREQRSVQLSRVNFRLFCCSPQSEMDALQQSIGAQSALIRDMKLSGQPVDHHVSELLRLKQQLAAATPAPFDRSLLEQVLTKRFFIAPSFQIYGGIAGLYDYGPPGSSLQQNILDIWRNHFCLEEDMLEIECTNLTPECVLKTSGHVERFADYMCKDLKTGDIFRADHVVKRVLEARIGGMCLDVLGRRH